MVKKIFFVIIGTLFIFHCGNTYFGRGWELIENGEYKEAQEYFSTKLKSVENNYMAYLGLGISTYHQNEFENAIKYLDQAEKISPDKSEIKYYIGLCFETMKQYDNAQRYYEYFKDQSIDSRYKSEMEKRYYGVMKIKYAEAAKSLIARESQLQAGENTLAILSFENNSGNPEYEPLTQGLPVMFITDFSLVPGLKVIERLRLKALLDEININKEGKMESATIQRAGKLLAAKEILKGVFKILPDNYLSIDLVIIDVPTGEIKYPLSRSAKFDDFYRLEKELVLDMAGKMKLNLSDDIRRKILTIPTESFFNFLERIKQTIENERIDLPSAPVAMDLAPPVQITPSPILERLNTVDNNTGTEKTEQRTDVPSRFLPDPPLPPK